MASRVPVQLAGFAVALGAVFGGGALLGSAVPPVAGVSGQVQVESPGESGHSAGHSAGHGAEHAASEGISGSPDPVGLSMMSNGYTVQLLSGAVASPGDVPVRLRVVDAAGAAVTQFDTVHDKQLHLIVVSADLSQFEHVHPQMAASGDWTTTVRLDASGGYRLYADFTPTGGSPTVLAANLTVSGTVAPQPLPAISATAHADGYDVLVAGHADAGVETELRFTIQRDGQPVTDLEPYLGADGHLVAIREGDLAYLHTHPSGATTGGPTISFGTTFPSAGAYRVFLDFLHDGVVHTAAFTVEVESH